MVQTKKKGPLLSLLLLAWWLYVPVEKNKVFLCCCCFRFCFFCWFDENKKIRYRRIRIGFFYDEKKRWSKFFFPCTTTIGYVCMFIYTWHHIRVLRTGLPSLRNVVSSALYLAPEFGARFVRARIFCLVGFPIYKYLFLEIRRILLRSHPSYLATENEKKNKKQTNGSSEDKHKKNIFRTRMRWILFLLLLLLTDSINSIWRRISKPSGVGLYFQNARPKSLGRHPRIRMPTAPPYIVSMFRFALSCFYPCTTSVRRFKKHNTSKTESRIFKRTTRRW
jgi:hypothetical protein